MKLLVYLIVLVSPLFALAQTTINLNADTLLQRTTIFLSPQKGTVIAGATLEVSFFINTEGKSVNTIELDVKFPPDKLAIVKPSGGRSLISIWAEPPRYSNTAGTATFVGVIPKGIVTEGGLITTITFKALASGSADVTVADTSRVFANDGLGTESVLSAVRGEYLITPVSPAGITVYSDTHPVQYNWYNDPNPIFSWQREPDVTDFSLAFDNKPFTVPDNIADTAETTKEFENVEDGIWYFHLKAHRRGVWGQTTHFAVRLDTHPPVEFTPQLQVLAATISRALVSFFTTDNLSGIDHYEVGVVDKRRFPAESPAFVQTESPYQLSNFTAGDLVVVIRAFDRAGNVRDETLDTALLPAYLAFLKSHALTTALILLLFLGVAIIFHYLYGHHLIRIWHRAVTIARREEWKEEHEGAIEKLKNERHSRVRHFLNRAEGHINRLKQKISRK